jgi:hypothetical protein
MAEDWDAEFDLEVSELKLGSPLARASIMVEDWDSERQDQAPSPKKPAKLVGITSMVKENWEDDFDFSESNAGSVCCA